MGFSDEQLEHVKKVIQIKDVTIVFSKDQNDKINSEVDEYMAGMGPCIDHYLHKRKATNPETVKKNLFGGKKAEYFATDFFQRDFGFPVTPPDVTIYDSKHKGWDSDLEFSKTNIAYPDVHVKSCSDNTLGSVGDYSWTWNYANSWGRGGKDSLFRKTNADLIAMVFLSTGRSAESTVKAVLPWSVVLEYLKDPALDRFIGIKKCIYQGDLLLYKKEIEASMQSDKMLVK